MGNSAAISDAAAKTAISEKMLRMGLSLPLLIAVGKCRQAGDLRIQPVGILSPGPQSGDFRRPDLSEIHGERHRFHMSVDEHEIRGFAVNRIGENSEIGMISGQLGRAVFPSVSRDYGVRRRVHDFGTPSPGGWSASHSRFPRICRISTFAGCGTGIIKAVSRKFCS
ncbi:hypothetical protein SDC9_114653 [bioreactor metagenome]|uniref:Uncharacterized protein n=1 Tax=bioreactor metagenome TaxID=1076179 RepID=A0A645BQN5_9ZZZZ